ncbi:MAG: hypothetical protein L3J28_00805 [Candidatus Polarisedimenticolaceae bacterium]|nr:hypothetical protein [Candidatus Polarisedimenticolaceae bacterium]
MANSVGKSMTKLLLIITLMFQPVMLSYAMASMVHSHQQATSSMDHHTLHKMGDQHASDADASDNILDDCCNSAACCPAATIVATEIARSAPSTLFIHFYSPSWPVIDLSAEIKPPR